MTTTHFKKCFKREKAMQGHVYALINPSLPKMVKVGKTERDPERRAQELSSATGVPTPFIVGYSVFVQDCDAAELFVHVLLTERGHRIANNREFFNASLNDVVKILIECQARFEILDVTPTITEIESPLMSEEESTETLIQSLLSEANNFRDGTGGSFIDHIAAKERYESASKLGSEEATCALGELLIDAESPIYDLHRGTLTLQKAVQQGYPAFRVYVILGGAYFEVGQARNAEIAYTKAFDDSRLRHNLVRYRELIETPELFSGLEAESTASIAGSVAMILKSYFLKLTSGMDIFIPSVFLFEFIPLLRRLIPEQYSVDSQFSAITFTFGAAHNEWVVSTSLRGMDIYEQNYKEAIDVFRKQHSKMNK